MSHESDVDRLLLIQAALAGMAQRLQGMLLTAAETTPDAEELDAMQVRLGELREQIAEFTDTETEPGTEPEQGV
jgi:hypothetical protein